MLTTPRKYCSQQSSRLWT